MRGRLTGLSYNRDQSCNITVTIPENFADTYDQLKDEDVEVTIKKAARHRSLEANRYAWVLIDQIAACMHKKKEEIYRDAIRHIGGVSQVMQMDLAAVDRFRAIWEGYGIGNQVEIINIYDNQGVCDVVVWFGSSSYDTQQMSILLDNLIQDAEALGIPTITPKEEEKMLQRWSRKKEGNNNDQAHSGDHHPGDGQGLPQA